MTWIDGKIALVTGANTGIGFHTAKALACQGATVILAGRDPKKVETAVASVREASGRTDVHALSLDLASLRSVREAAETVLARFDALHLLVNNAGLVLSERIETEDGFEATFGINHLGHHALTRLLEDRMRESAPARVVNVSSDAHRQSRGLDFDDLHRRGKKYSGFAAYCDSKLANVLFTRTLAQRLDGSGVVTHALHPGVVRTGFGQDGDLRGPVSVILKVFRPLFTSPESGAKTSVHVATSDDSGSSTGEYWAKCRRVAPSAPARDTGAATRLWEISDSLTGFGP